MEFNILSHHYPWARIPVYIFIFIFSAIDLGLTGFRVHHTESIFGFYDPLIVAVLATAAVTILWLPGAIASMVKKLANPPDEAFPPHLAESIPWFIIWVMWIVVSAMMTNRFPATKFCGGGKQCRVVVSIMATSWIVFGLMTIIGVLLLMQAAVHSNETAYTTTTTTTTRRTAPAKVNTKSPHVAATPARPGAPVVATVPVAGAVPVPPAGVPLAASGVPAVAASPGGPPILPPTVPPATGPAPAYASAPATAVAPVAAVGGPTAANNV